MAREYHAALAHAARRVLGYRRFRPRGDWGRLQRTDRPALVAGTSTATHHPNGGVAQRLDRPALATGASSANNPCDGGVAQRPTNAGLDTQCSQPARSPRRPTPARQWEPSRGTGDILSSMANAQPGERFTTRTIRRRPPPHCFATRRVNGSCRSGNTTRGYASATRSNASLCGAPTPVRLA